MEIKAEFKIKDLAKKGYDAWKDDLRGNGFNLPDFSNLNDDRQHAWEEATRAILMSMLSSFLEQTKITDDEPCQTSPPSNGSVKNTPVNDTPPPKGLPEKEKPYKDLDGE